MVSPVEVTDPDLLAKLNQGEETEQPESNEVTDPALLAKLNAPDKPQYDPTEGMDIGDKFIAGMGKSMVDTGRGVYQLGASIGHAAGLVSDEKMKQIQADVDEAKHLDQPLMSSGYAKAGHIAGSALPFLIGQPESLLGTAAAGAASGAIEPVETGGPSRLQNATTGAIAAPVGQAVGKVAQGVLGGAGGAISKWAVNLLNKEGIPTSVAQKTGNKGAQMIERASEMVDSAPAEFRAQTQAGFNRAALKRIGADSDTASPEVLNDAHTAMTGTMDRVAALTKVKFDDDLFNDLADVESDAKATIPLSDQGPIHQNIKNILDNGAENNGYLDGEFYQKLRSNLGALSAHPATAPVAGDMLDAVNAAMRRSAHPQDVEALTDAMQKYRALQQIHPATDESGNISWNKLWNNINVRKNYKQAKLGQGNQDLVSLARAAKAVLPEKLGNSGTAERILPAMTALETLGSGDFLKAGTKALVGAGGLRAAGNVMRNQGVIGKYATSGIPVVNKLAPAAPSTVQGAAVGTAEDSRQQDQPIERASGGKVDHEALLARLVKRWKDAKKVSDKSTKPLLNVPDSAVAKALAVAQESI